MIFATACFAAEDMFLKSAATIFPVGQVSLYMGLIGVFIFCTMAKLRSESLWHRAYLRPVILVRSSFEITARMFYAIALAVLPLSTASSIMQAMPLVVMIAAVIIFRERVPPSAWLAALVGFGGVMMILRPGTESFSMLALWALGATICFGLRDVATRAAPPVLSNAQLGILGFTMLATAGLILSVSQESFAPPTLNATLFISCAGLCATTGYYALTTAMRSGNVALVAPFRYTRLIFAIILAMLVFKERPDALTLLGSVVIVASGLYILLLRKQR